mgnify:CR=1 FL=1
MVCRLGFGFALALEPINLFDYINPHRKAFGGIKIFIHRGDEGLFEGTVCQRFGAGCVQSLQCVIDMPKRTIRLLQALFCIVNLTAFVSGYS